MLGDLIAARLAITVVIMSKHGRDDDVDVLDDVRGAARLLHDIDALGLRPLRRGRRGARARRHAWQRPRATTPSCDARATRALGPQTLSYDEPLHVVRGEGAYLIGADGRRYLDAYNNVPVVGHCHPEVVRATAAQLATLNTNTRYLQRGRRRARRAADRLGAARARPGAVRQLGQRGERPRAADRPLRHRPPRSRWSPASPTTGSPRRRSRSRRRAGSTASRRPTSRCSTRPGHRPTLPHPGHPDVAAAVRRPRARGDRDRRLVHQRRHARPGARLGPPHRGRRPAPHGGLYVADEVQAGFGRTGDALWSVAAAGVAPDFITLGKPMGNGFPVAAVITRAELADPFIAATDYFSTFGGNTVAAAAGLAVLRVIEEEGLIERARERGAHLRARLEAHPRRSARCGPGA